MIRRTLSSGGYLAAATVIQILAAFGGNLILFRALAPDDIGRFAITLAGISIAASVCSLRLGSLILRASEAEFTFDTQRLYFSALVLEAAVVTTISTAWLLISSRHSFLDFVLLGAIVLQNFCIHNRAYWERKMVYRTLAGVEVVVALTAQAGAVAAVFILGDVTALYLREVIASLTLVAGLWAVGGLTLYRPRLLRRADSIRLFGEARSLWLDSVLEGLFQRFALLMAGAFSGERGAGLFAMAQRLAVLPHQLLFPFGRVILNWFARTEAPTSRQKARDRFIAALVVILTSAAVAIFQFSDIVVPWLFGAHWSEAIPVLVAMTGAVVFMSPFEITRGYSVVTAHSRALLAGRVLQFAAFSAVALLFARQSQPEMWLGLGWSFAFAAAFAVQLVMLRRSDTR